MADALSLDFEDGASDRIAAAEKSLHAGLLDVAGAVAASMLDDARARAGTELRTISGAFRDSLSSRVEASDESFAAILSDDAPQARILEFGGTIGAHDIMPHGDALAFLGGGVSEIFAKIVHSPGGTIAARPVLLEAREDATAQWGEGLDAVLARFMEDI